MAITTAMPTSFKKELFEAKHNFLLTGGNTFNAALYVAAATMDATTTVYAATNEVANGNGYATGGQDLTRIDPTTSGTTAFVDFADEVWSTASFTARGTLIYNVTNGNRAVYVGDFGADKTASGGDFTLAFPAAAAGTAILRIA